jgi:hypothetical protein
VAKGKLLSVGDVLGPRGKSGGNLACLQLMRDHNIPSVLGNHDGWVHTHYKNGMEPWAIEYVTSWPHEYADDQALVTHTLLERGLTCPHFLTIRTPEEVKLLLRRRPLVFTGHIHLPGYWCWEPFGEPVWKSILEPTAIDLHPDFRYLIQVGSLGEPEGPDLPRYLTWENRRVEWHRLQVA